jgi:hypothetical protein
MRLKWILALLVVVSLTASCKRDKRQIKRTWVIERVRIGGADLTSEYTKNHYTETYGDDGVYSFSGDPDGNSGAGKYDWDGKQTIKRNGVSNQESMTLSVQTLTSDEFEYHAILNGAEAEFKFRKK